eukprot:CAMPEP_0180505532 /NCGR_PEP_ID=MMETSP1036_2-20121128/47423_1 /TAXON_ID=632150 /ORGANISM="Azadinium spinosum, Strain 3D9" /LENGTH=49 /DNA_ID= /DNA_START= /DNA_END= /DNA_ORIENTATION=
MRMVNVDRVSGSPGRIFLRGPEPSGYAPFFGTFSHRAINVMVALRPPPS